MTWHTFFDMHTLESRHLVFSYATVLLLQGGYLRGWSGAGCYWASVGALGLAAVTADSSLSASLRVRNDNINKETDKSNRRSSTPLRMTDFWEGKREKSNEAGENLPASLSEEVAYAAFVTRKRRDAH